MNYVDPFPSVMSSGLDSSIECCIIHPHKGRGKVSLSYRGGIGDMKKSIVNVTVYGSSI